MDGCIVAVLVCLFEWVGKTNFLVKELARGSKGGIRPLCPCARCRRRHRQGKDDMTKHLWLRGYMPNFVTSIDFAHYEKMEADTGGPVTDMAVWQKMKTKMKKPDLDTPQPSLPEYFGTSGEDLDLYCSTFQGFHPEVDDPIQEVTDKTSLIVSGHDKQHGHHHILNAVVKPTTSPARIRPTLTIDIPPIMTRRQPRRSTDPDFLAAYDSAHVEYLAAHQAWTLKRDVYDKYQELVCDLFTRFITTGERGSVPERPARPGPPPYYPSREEFSRTYYSGTAGTECLENQPFDRASASPGSSREIIPLHIGGRSPGASASASSRGSTAKRRRSHVL